MKPMEILRQRVKRAVAELFAVAGDAGDVWAGAVVEPDQLADERDLLLAAVAEGGAEPLGQLGVGGRLGVVVEDLEAPAEQRTQYAVGHIGAVRLRAPAEEPHGLGAQLEPALDLGHQSGLAEPGVADNRNARQGSLLSNRLEGIDQSR